MGLIGKIWVKLGLDNSEFKQGIKGAEKEASGFQSFIKGVGPSVAAAFSIGAIVNFGKAAVKAYNESALALAKLEAVIRSTGNASGLSSKQMQDYAAELQRVTTFEDDATINAMALLSTFKSIQGDTFKQTIASAQDLATVLGTDLNGAVMQLGKALEAPEIGLTMLRRSGISFSNQQIEQIKKLVEEGRKHEAQMVMLKEVQSQFGGAAKAAAATADGAWKQLGNTIGDVMEDLGSGVESTRGMAKSMNEYIISMRNMWKNDDIWTSTKIWTTLFGWANNDALEFANAEAARKDKATKDNEAWVAAQMEGIKSIEDAEKAKAELGWQIMTERGQMFKTSLDMYVKEANKKQEQIQLDKEEAEAYAKTAEGMKEAQEKAKQAALERAKYIMGTSAYYERLIKEARELNEVEENANLRADRELEIRNLEYKLELTKKTKDELKEIQALRARDIRAGGEVPYVQNTITGKVTTKQKDPILAYRDKYATDSLPALEAELERYKNLYNRIDATQEQKEFFKTQIDGLEEGIGKLKDGMTDFNKEFSEEVMRSANIASNFGQAVAQSMSESMKIIFDAISSGEEIDASAMTKAILMPFADMAVQIGEVMVATGAAALAAKAIGKVGGPGAAIAAGAVLMALGAAAQSQIGRIGSSFGAGSSEDPYSYTGGKAVSNVSVQPIQVYGVLKGQDIYLSSEKYKQNKSR